MPLAETLGDGAARLGSALAGAFAPPLCWSCSGLARRGEPLCSRCRASLHRLPPDPLFLSGVRVWAPVAYSGPARDLIRALKFRGATAVADAMAAQIVANAPPMLLDGRTIVPVPLHPKRLRSRGYNQAAVIAQAVGRRAGLAVIDCLTRAGPSVTQVGRDSAQRRAGPAGSIELRSQGGPAASSAPSGGTPALSPSVRGASSSVPPARVLLVDDVVTTGATLGACRDALVAAGAREVGAIAFARTIGR
jgi:predicted amidophosphoribosyltransferase